MSIRKKVANLWAPLLQSKGNSTTQPMSQKAVSDELSQLKSDLDSKVKYSDSLSYEEIMATTDLTNKVASASATRQIANIIRYKLFDGVESISFDSIYNSMKTGMMSIYSPSEGDYYLIQLYRDSKYGCQIRIKLDGTVLQIRANVDGVWSSWRSF